MAYCTIEATSVVRHDSRWEMMNHIALIPSLDCPARCEYCFGPRQPSPVMSEATLKSVAEWISHIYHEKHLEISFHGGEPLMAGECFFQTALPLLTKALRDYHLYFHMQSNLWLLTDELCSLFRYYNIHLGTSLDGPESINDIQRGRGYFQRTMEGIELARSYGLSIGCICTLTAQSAHYTKDIFDFFALHQLPFSIRPAAPSLWHSKADEWSLSPRDGAASMHKMLRYYITNMSRVRINTFDIICQSICAGQGGMCTFTDCLGKYLAVGPEGDIYPCQRFVGLPQYRLGTVNILASKDVISSSSAWQLLQDRENRVEEECGNCPYFSFCRGGCPYDVLSSNRGTFNHTFRDPFCIVHKSIFSYIVDTAIEEVFSEYNLCSVVNNPDQSVGLLSRGNILSIMLAEPRSGHDPPPNNASQTHEKRLSRTISTESGCHEVVQ